MKSIKTNPNPAKGPDKGKIVNKLYCILLTTLELTCFLNPVKNPMFTCAIFIRPDSELIRESVCACAKLFFDEESTSNRVDNTWVDLIIFF
jgi:hypothetical protein